MEEKLEYPKGARPQDYPVAVMVGRFQVDEFHDGHKTLIDMVTKNHETVILFLGIPVVKHGEENPLDYETRKVMIQNLHPTITILPLEDQRTNKLWSKTLDLTIQTTSEGTPLLYGSRDSFIPKYSGVFDTCELISNISKVSGTKMREEVSKTPIDHPFFRKGVIYSNFDRYPNIWPCADVVVLNADDDTILLGRKPKEKEFRFIGGHVDPSDESYEHAALRELREEAGGNLSVGGLDEVMYICSGKIADWRHAEHTSEIFSTLFLVQRKWGKAEPNDDIAETKWFPIVEVIKDGFSENNIVEEHRDFFAELVKVLVARETAEHGIVG